MGMSKEEAIHILDNLKPTNTKSSFDAYVVGKAITMAIKALEQEPITKNDSIDYCRAFKIACELLNGSILYGIDADRIFEIMMAKDGVVSSNSYESYILNNLQELDRGQYASEPTTKNNLAVDCIDRAELLKAMDTWDKFGNDPNVGLIPLRTPALQDRYVPYVKYDDMVNCVKGIPSVTPQEPRKGHWMNKHRLFDSCSAECSSCHKRSNGYLHDNGFSLVSTYYDFCPKCGSDNREVTE